MTTPLLTVILAAMAACINEHGHYRCGKCTACVTLKQRQWVGRLIMEARASCEAYFLTLTYAPENLPLDPETFIPTLKPTDLTKFIKRLRAPRGGNLELRYFACGEYGDKGGRPHYHMILFLPEPAPHNLEDIINEKWKLGYVAVAEFTEARAGYIAGYTTKKILQRHTPSGCHPEFQRQSQGLGRTYVTEHLAPFLGTHSGKAVIRETGDVPKVFRHNGSIYPLPDYLLKLLRDRARLQPTALGRATEYVVLGGDFRKVIPKTPTRLERQVSRIKHQKTIRRIREKARGVL